MVYRSHIEPIADRPEPELRLSLWEHWRATLIWGGVFWVAGLPNQLFPTDDASLAWALLGLVVTAGVAVWEHRVALPKRIEHKLLAQHIQHIQRRLSPPPQHLQDSV